MYDTLQGELYQIIKEVLNEVRLYLVALKRAYWFQMPLDYEDFLGRRTEWMWGRTPP